MDSTVDRYFDVHKQQCLIKCDLSRKGSVDVDVEHLVGEINKSSEYFTTSSCSGRLALVTRNDKCDKRSCKFYMNSHEPISLDTFKQALNESEMSEELVLKFEPFILHVQCKSLESAKTLHTLALDCGFRNSGLTLGKHGKVTLAVRSTLTLETPLGAERAKLLDDAYLTFLVQIVREKFAANDRLRAEFEKKFILMLRSDSE